jgi:phosphoribosylamine--glycine ligase
MKRVLIVGSGAREHALAWKLAQSPHISKLYVAPGNAGTKSVAENVPIAATDLVGICRFVESHGISLTVIGPEAPLGLGLADWLRARGRRVVGPDRAAARIETSKAFAKDVMLRAGVPTARYAVFEHSDDALSYVDDVPLPCVVKVDGLAAGKGVAMCFEREEARSAICAAMQDEQFGEAGRRVVIEEYLEGPEVSIMALVDGERAVPLAPAQDHKRLGDGDTGPNTGGMGAYAPVPFLDTEAVADLTGRTVQPIVSALAEMGLPYRGVLFAGLMLTRTGPQVLEYNCRLGDPETQVMLPIFEGDLLPWLEAVADGTLPAESPRSNGYAAGVVLAAPGYPDAPQTGTPIQGLDHLPPDVLAFHAGTAVHARGDIITAGGRVLTLVGTGSTLGRALGAAYSVPLYFAGMQRRSDIGQAGMEAVQQRKAS